MTATRTATCPSCNTILGDEDRICAQCGAVLNVWSVTPQAPLILPGNPALSDDDTSTGSSAIRRVSAALAAIAVVGGITFAVTREPAARDTTVVAEASPETDVADSASAMSSGVVATEATRGGALRPARATLLACFAAPAAGELVVGNRKLVASAQVRERGALLQHGSILVDDDQPRIASLASGGLTAALPAATLRTCLGRAPSYADVRDALRMALVAAVPRVTALDPAESSAYAQPLRAQFASAEWTWRR